MVAAGRVYEGSVSFDPITELVNKSSKKTGCLHHPMIDRPSATALEAFQWNKTFDHCTPDARWEHERFLGRYDLFYLLNCILEVPRVGMQWHFERCQEVMNLTQGVFDAWTRGSGKSAIISYGNVIRRNMIDPDYCFMLFSHTRPLAKELLRKIKQTYEGHQKLKWLYPDILWSNPEVEAPVWSLDHGITLKRKSVTRGEATVEAYGLVDGQPTGRHPDELIFDDIQKEKISDYMIDQIENSFDTAMGLGSTKPTRWSMIGVFFRGGSVYDRLIERGVALPRIRPAMFPDGSSPIWNDEEVRETIKLVSPAVLACEYLMDPARKAEGEGFKEEWLRYHDGIDLRSCYLWLIVDPGSGGKKKGSGSKSALWIVATRADRKLYVIDGVNAPLSLAQRADWTLALHRQYNPKKIFYEKYGMQGDIEYIKERVKREGYHPEGGFTIEEITAKEGSKDDRIEWLVPAFREGLIVMPKRIPERVINDEVIDVMKNFLENEFRKYPATKSKDLLDCLAWSQWKDLGLTWPEGYDDVSIRRKEIDWDEGSHRGSWMSE